MYELSTILGSFLDSVFLQEVVSNSVSLIVIGFLFCLTPWLIGYSCAHIIRLLKG